MLLMTSSGMSSHGSNGLGSVVATMGDLMLVVVSPMGAEVERSSTPPVLSRPTGSDCQRTITAATSAHTADEQP